MSATQETETTSGAEQQNIGRIEEIQGVVIEAVFPDRLPEINHAIRVPRPEAARAEEDEDIAAQSDPYLVCEVQQHLGDNRVHAVAMDATDGLAHESPRTCSGQPAALGRVGPAGVACRPAPAGHTAAVGVQHPEHQPGEAEHRQRLPVRREG